MKTRVFYFSYFLVACLLALSCGGDDNPQEPVLVGDLILNTQEDVDAAVRRGHVEIQGSLIIDNGAGQFPLIEDLSGLSTITSISGDLRIERTTQLTSLEGLNNLETIGGNVQILSNLELLNIEALRNVTNYGEPEVSIMRNVNLGSLNGLQGLTMAKTLEIESNTRLPDLSGLNNLRGVTHRFNFRKGTDNTRLEGLSSLEFTGDFYLSFYDRDNLRGLSSLDSISGQFLISGLSDLTDLSDLSHISYINDFSLSSCPSLTSLNGLGSVGRIARLLSIIECDGLTDMRGLELKSRFQNIILRDNEKLVSLNGLNDLAQVNDLEISQNEILSDISALGKLTNVFNQLGIWDNPQLQTLNGLEGLTSVRRFSVFDNTALEAMATLDNLESLGDLDISRNPNLTSLLSCENLITMDRFSASENGSLIDFCGVANVDIRVNYHVLDNAFNPSQEDLINGRCRQ